MDALRIGKGVWNARAPSTEQERRNDTAVRGGADASRCRASSNVLYHLRAIDLIPAVTAAVAKEEQGCDCNEDEDSRDSNGDSDLNGRV